MSALNDFIGGIQLSTYGYSDAITYGFYLSKGNTKPPSVLNFSFNPIILGLSIVPTSTIALLSTPADAEDWDSEQYITAKDTFSDGVYWLWGSLDAGGCYIRKVSDNPIAYTIGGVTCWYRNRSNDKLAYYIQEANRTYALRDLNDVCFLYDEGHIEDDYPSIEVFSTANLRGRANVPINYYYYKTYNAFLPGGYPIDGDPLWSMYDCTRWITWEGALGDSPSCYWYGSSYNELDPPPYNLNYKILGIYTSELSSISPISGDEWGGERNVDDSDGDESNEEGGTSQEGGGYGGYPSETGHNGKSNPQNDAVNAVNSGFVTLYNPTLAEVKAFNGWLFSDATFTDALANSVKRLMANPMDFVLFLALCRFTPPSTVTDTIQFCGINTTVTAKKINNQFYQLDCGSISGIHDTNTFLDYNPKTSAQIFLPYIGFREINIDDITGKYSTISLTYNIDMLNGSCLAQLHCKRGVRVDGDAQIDDVLYSWQGNCFETMPLTGTDWRGLLGSIISGVSSGLTAIGGIASGNAGAVMGGISGIASAVISDKVNVQRSGSSSGSFGYMDNQKPYIILTRPVNNMPKNYASFRGYASNITKTLSEVKGYAEIIPDTLWCNDMNGILDEEVAMLKDIVSKGIIL